VIVDLAQPSSLGLRLCRLAAWAGLDREEVAGLKQAEATSQREYKITVRPDFSDSDRETAALLARFGELPRDKHDSLHNLLKRSFG
jgi:hypothetical protein